MLLISACAQNVDTAYQTNDDNGTRLNANRNARVVKDDANIDRASSQNPNFINIAGNGRSTGQDIDKARQVIKSSTKYQPGEVWINGPNMWVTVYQKEKLSQKEKIHAEARVHKILTRALPRYNIEVKVREDRT